MCDCEKNNSIGLKDKKIAELLERIKNNDSLRPIALMIESYNDGYKKGFEDGYDKGYGDCQNDSPIF